MPGEGAREAAADRERPLRRAHARGGLIGTSAARPRLYEIAALLQSVLVVAAVAATLPVRLRVGPMVETTLPFALVVAGALAACAAVRAIGIAIAVAAKGQRGPLRARRYLRALARPRSLVELARFLAAVLLVSFGYSWLKVFLQRLHPIVTDAALTRIDTAVHFGLDPGKLVIGLFPYRWIWRALDVEYALFFAGLLLTIGWFGSVLSWRERARFASGFAFLWLVGSWWYLAMPSLGPCYLFPETYREVLAAMPLQANTQALLMKQYLALRSGSLELNASLGIAAMPSLHVGAQVFASVWAGRRNPRLALFFALAALLTFLGSVLSGWHYAIDGYAGALLGWAAARWGRSGIGVPST